MNTKANTPPPPAKKINAVSYVLHDKILFSIGRTLRVETTTATRTKEKRWWIREIFTPRPQELGTFTIGYVVLAALFSRALRGLALSVTSFLCWRLCSLSCFIVVAGKTQKLGIANNNLQRIKSRLDKPFSIYSGAFSGTQCARHFAVIFYSRFSQKSASGRCVIGNP
jgi:hypothetical protein